MRGRGLPLAVGLAVLGGLMLVGATSGHWLRAEELREVGGVPLTEPRGTPGVELAPRAVALGVLAALIGLALIPARGRVRRALGLLLVGVGSAGAAFVAAGVVAATGEPGQLTAAPWVAALGAVAILAGGVVAWRRPAPAPALGERYSIDADEADEHREWGTASDDD